MKPQPGDVIIRKVPGVPLVSFELVVDDQVEPDGDAMLLDEDRARASRTIAETGGRVYEVEDTEST